MHAAAHADPEGAPPDVPLPRLEEGVPVSATTPLLVVGASEVRFEERGVGGLEDLTRAAETLATDVRVAARVAQGGGPFVLGLWADPSVPIATLEELTRGLPPEVRLVLLARGPATAWLRAEGRPSALPPWVTGALERSDPIYPHRARIRLEEAWERALPHCEPAVAQLPDRERGAVRRAEVEALVASVRRCGCEELELPQLTALAMRAIANPEGGLLAHQRALRFGAATGPGDDLEVSGTVAELAEALSRLPAEGPALWVRDPGE